MLNQVAILPAGALGVSFFSQLTHETKFLDGTVYFIQRTQSRSAKEIEKNPLKIVNKVTGSAFKVQAPWLFQPDLVSCYKKEVFPNVLIACPDTNQLFDVIEDYINLLQFIHEFHTLNYKAIDKLPIVLLSSNGIYFQHLQQFFREKIEEGILFEKLPKLTPIQVSAINDKLLRGVTNQTGVRIGANSQTIYQLGSPKTTTLCGDRGNCIAAYNILATKGGLFDVGMESTPTFYEFEKAMVNLCSNIYGQVLSIDNGQFTLLTVKDITAEQNRSYLKQIVFHLIQIGEAIHVLPPGRNVDATFDKLMIYYEDFLNHIPSSLQWLNTKIKTGTYKPHFTSLELWLFNPLYQYAHGAGLHDSVKFFEDLRHELWTKLNTIVVKEQNPMISLGAVDELFDQVFINSGNEPPAELSVNSVWHNNETGKYYMRAPEAWVEATQEEIGKYLEQQNDS